MSWYYGFRPYVPVHKRRANAARYAAQLAKKEKRTLAPIDNLTSRTIATSFWGKAWCENLEAYSDFENRLPRGRTYVRNGSVIDLQIKRGRVEALVSGSEIYHVIVEIMTLPKNRWNGIKEDCSRSITSLMDLLAGRFDEAVMSRLCRRDHGLFPQPKELKMKCSCPDWAGMCKHVAATLYGVGARLDRAPELLFKLRAVDHLELINQAIESDHLTRTLDSSANDSLASSELGEIFGIDLAIDSTAPSAAAKAKAGVVKKAAPRSIARSDNLRKQVAVQKSTKRVMLEKIKKVSREAPATAKNVKPRVGKPKVKDSLSRDDVRTATVRDRRASRLS